jgi:RNA polymerase sigma factor for flagellar operon FliA
MRAYAKAVRDPARERLIAEHLDMGRRIALRVARRAPDWLGQEDLVAAAMVGLAEAAERYDPSRGEPFVAFAEKRIRGAVLDELRRGDLLPRRARWAARRVGEAIRNLEHRLGRAPEDAEVAKALSVPIEEYRDELQQLTQVGFVELGEAPDTPGAIGGSPADRVERAELIERIHACLHRLGERDALVLSLYYLEEFNYQEIAEVLDVSESRVCQLHGRALARLRAEVDAPAPNAIAYDDH